MKFTLKEAAAACGISLSTIRRKHSRGEFADAFQDDAGTWHIPLTGLLGAGLKVNQLGRSPDVPVAVPHDRPADQGVNDALAVEVVQLREQLRDEQHRRVVAETMATERAQSLEDLRLSLRAIAGPETNSAGRDLEPSHSPPGGERRGLRAWFFGPR